MIPDSVIRENARKAVSEYHRRHQKKENIPRIIHDCKHIQLAISPPPKTIEEIGWHRFCMDTPNKIYVVDGPDNNDECLASLHYVSYDVSGNPKSERRIENTIMSPELRIHGIGYLDCIDSEIIKFYFGGTKAIFADGNSCISESGTCEHTFTTGYRFPGTYQVNVAAHAVVKQDQVCSTCRGKFNLVERSLLAYITQKRRY